MTSVHDEVVRLSDLDANTSPGKRSGRQGVGRVLLQCQNWLLDHPNLTAVEGSIWYTGLIECLLYFVRTIRPFGSLNIVGDIFTAPYVEASPWVYFAPEHLHHIGGHNHIAVYTSYGVHYAIVTTHFVAVFLNGQHSSIHGHSFARSLLRQHRIHTISDTRKLLVSLLVLISSLETIGACFFQPFIGLGACPLISWRLRTPWTWFLSQTSFFLRSAHGVLCIRPLKFYDKLEHVFSTQINAFKVNVVTHDHDKHLCQSNPTCRFETFRAINVKRDAIFLNMACPRNPLPAPREKKS